MSRLLRPSLWFTSFALPVALFTAPVHANQLVYVPLTQPCRLLDTRASTGGAGALTAAHGAYLFGTSTADIVAQNGNSAGCGIPAGIEAVSVNMNLLNASASGNIATWSASVGPTAPNIGTAVYNPTITGPAAGQVQYNTGYSNVPVGYGSGSSGRFYLQVANGQSDMTINLIGYWMPISWAETRGALGVALGYGTTAENYSTAIGVDTFANGNSSTAMGYNTHAIGDNSTAMGFATHAVGDSSTAMGIRTSAAGDYSTAMGSDTTASGTSSTAMGSYAHAIGNNSAAMGVNTTASGYSSFAIGESTNAIGSHSMATGYQTSADGELSIAMGANVGSGGHTGSFIYGDASRSTGIVNSANNQFMAVADGGFVMVSKADGSTGAELKPGNSSWTTLSDRNAKTAAQPVDGREVLKKVAALPLNTWQYKAQEAKYRHMGPMAQDFYAAFRLGESDKGIDTVDADGVALAAIQGLNVLLSEKDGQIATLRAEAAAQAKDKDEKIAKLRAELMAHVAAFESLSNDLTDVKAQLAALHTRASAVEVSVALQQPR